MRFASTEILHVSYVFLSNVLATLCITVYTSVAAIFYATYRSYSDFDNYYVVCHSWVYC